MPESATSQPANNYCPSSAVFNGAVSSQWSNVSCLIVISDDGRAQFITQPLQETSGAPYIALSKAITFPRIQLTQAPFRNYSIKMLNPIFVKP